MLRRVGEKKGGSAGRDREYGKREEAREGRGLRVQQKRTRTELPARELHEGAVVRAAEAPHRVAQPHPPARLAPRQRQYHPGLRDLQLAQQRGVGRAALYVLL